MKFYDVDQLIEDVKFQFSLECRFLNGDDCKDFYERSYQSMWDLKDKLVQNESLSVEEKDELITEMLYIQRILCKNHNQSLMDWKTEHQDKFNEFCLFFIEFCKGVKSINLFDGINEPHYYLGISSEDKEVEEVVNELYKVRNKQLKIDFEFYQLMAWISLQLDVSMHEISSENYNGLSCGAGTMADFRRKYDKINLPEWFLPFKEYFNM